MAVEPIDIPIRVRGAARGASAIRRLGRTASTAARAFTSLRGALFAFGAAISVREIIELTDSFRRLNNQLKQVTDTSENLTGVQREVFEIANATRVPVEATATVFRRLAQQADRLGLSQRELLDITKTVNQTLAISGATAQEARAGLIQFSQGLASSRLSGDELRSVLEQLPRLAEVVATGFGVSVGELRALGQAGALSSLEVARAVQSQAEIVNAEFEKIGPTTEQAFTVVRNQLLRTVGVLDAAGISTANINQFIIETADTFTTKLPAAIATGIDAFADLIGITANVSEALETIGLGAADLAASFGVAGASIKLVFAGINVAINQFRVRQLEAQAETKIFGSKIGLVPLKEAQEAVARLGKAQLDLGKSIGNTLVATKGLSEAFVEFNAASLEKDDFRFTDQLRRLEDAASGAADRIRAANEEQKGFVSEEGGTAVTPLSKSALGEQERSLKKLLKLLNDLQDAELERVDPLLVQLAVIERQVEEVEALKVSTQAEVVRQEVLQELAEERTRLRANALESERDIVSLQDDLEQGLRRLLILDRERSKDIREQLNLRLAEAAGVEEQAEAIRLALMNVNDAIEAEAPNFARTLSDGLRVGLGDALTAGVTGGDFQATLQAALEETVKKGLNDAFDEAIGTLQVGLEGLLKDLGEGLSESLGNVFGKDGPLSGVGSFFSEFIGEDAGKALGNAAGAALGIGLNALANSKTKSDFQTFGVEGDAIERLEPVRGVIVGPTSISIAQVDRAIREANVGVEDRLSIIIDLTEETNALLRRGSASVGATTGTDETSAALAGESSALF